MADEVIQPLVKLRVLIECTNPRCRYVWSIENFHGDCLVKCRKCGKNHYIRIAGQKVFVRPLRGSVKKFMLKTPKNV